MVFSINMSIFAKRRECFSNLFGYYKTEVLRFKECL
jgi:hypothetical protein